MKIKELFCSIKAIPFWIRSGFNKDCFITHVYREVGEYPAKIFVNQQTGRFRIADSYAHEFEEKYEPNAVIIGLQCKYCGKISAEYKLPWHKDNVGEEEMSNLYGRYEYEERR